MNSWRASVRRSVAGFTDAIVKHSKRRVRRSKPIADAAPRFCSLGKLSGLPGQFRKPAPLTLEPAPTRDLRSSMRSCERGRLSRAVNTTDGWQQVVRKTGRTNDAVLRISSIAISRSRRSAGTPPECITFAAISSFPAESDSLSESQLHIRGVSYSKRGDLARALSTDKMRSIDPRL